MALAGFLNRYLHYQRIVKGLLTKHNPLMARYRGKSALTPHTDFTGTPGLFSMAKVNEYPETIPLVIICIAGGLFQFAWIARNTFTRNDIKWWSTFGFEKAEQEIIDGKPPKIQKLMVIRQKYEWPEGLVKAYRGASDDNDKCKDVKKKK